MNAHVKGKFIVDRFCFIDFQFTEFLQNLLVPAKKSWWLAFCMLTLWPWLLHFWPNRQIQEPIGHWCRGTLSSAISTSSPVCKFLCVLCHFWSSCEEEMYSLRQRFQWWLSRSCAWRHRFRLNLSLSSTISGGRLTVGRMFKKWLGVRGPSSFGLEEFLVSGLELAIRSSSVNTAWSTTSLIRSLPRIVFRLRCTDFTSLSQTPDMCDAPWGWNTHLQPCCCNSLPTFSLSISNVPFYWEISSGTKMKSSVSRVLVTSRWMAREFIHTKMAPHRFSATFPLPLFTQKGPK